MSKRSAERSIPQVSETGLGKTFLIGMATPPVWLTCNLTRQDAPRWITQEFKSSMSKVRSVCFAFGLAAGAAAITGPTCLGVFAVMDEYSASSKQSKASSSAHVKKDMRFIPAVDQ